MLSPSTRMRPWSGTSSMLMQRNKVLLPEPLAPISEITSPSRAVRETPLRTSILPKRLCRRSTSIMVLPAIGSAVAVAGDAADYRVLGASPFSTRTKSRIRWQALAQSLFAQGERESHKALRRLTEGRGIEYRDTGFAQQTPGELQRGQAGAAHVHQHEHAGIGVEHAEMPGQSAMPATTRSRRRR